MAQNEAFQQLAWQQMWSNASAWEELLNLNRRYLKGEIDISASCNHPIDAETSQILPGLLRLTDFGLLTISSQPEEAGNPEYMSGEDNVKRLVGGDYLPEQKLAYLQNKLHRLETGFSPEQLEKNDMAVIQTVRDKEQEHIAVLGTYRANEIVDSGSPGTDKVVNLYRSAIKQAQKDFEEYNKQVSMCWRQYRQRQYLHFLIPTTHPKIPLKAVIRFIERLKSHKDLVVAFQYEMNGENPQRQPPAHRVQDPAALELFGKFTTTVPLRVGPEIFWWPVTQSREAGAFPRYALFDTPWRSHTHLGLDFEEHISGFLFGHYNEDAYPAGVAADPVAVLVGLIHWESDIDLLALIVGILEGEGLEDLFTEVPEGLEVPKEEPEEDAGGFTVYFI